MLTLETPMKKLALIAISCLVVAACETSNGDTKPEAQSVDAAAPEVPAKTPTSAPAKDPSRLPAEVDVAPAGKAIATFAGGCFWCMEKPFEVIDGVDAVYSGYTAGPEKNPTYKQVSSGATGHTEAVRVIYDPAKVKYSLLLQVYWRSINPTQVNGQFADHGTQYRTGIYYHDAEQKKLAEISKEEIAKKFDAPIAVEIKEANDFWPAEVYHQDYYLKNSAHYERYRVGSGRAGYLDKTWGDEAYGYSLHKPKKK